jgi:hypothetical protein
MIKSIIKFLFNRSCKNAEILIINISSYLNDKDLKDTWAYLEALYDYLQEDN